MRLLVIVPYVPTPIRIRPYSLLKTLVARGHEVTLATLWTTEDERAYLAELEALGLRIVAHHLPRYQSLKNCLTKLPSAMPLQAVYCWQPAFKQVLEQLITTEPFDAIHVEHLRGAQYGLALTGHGIPVIWDSVDCISHLFEQAVVHSKSLFGKWMTRLELGRTRRYEGWLLDQFSTVLVTSPVDKEALLKLANTHNSSAETDRSNWVKVLPNGVDHAYFSPGQEKPDAETLVFSGKMSYHANVTMALYLVHDIMPHIWAECPQVKLLIVGKDPPSSIQNLAQDARVEVTGFVADIRPYIQKATVAVAPVAYGAGIQNKILEAMACGTPVVTMERAISALTLEPGREILVANDSYGFAQQVLNLLKDHTLRKTVSIQGRKYILRQHDWSQIGADLEGIYSNTTRLQGMPQQGTPQLHSL